MTVPNHCHIGLDCKDTAFFLQQDIADVSKDVRTASNQVGNLVSDNTRTILQDACGNTKDILKEVSDKSSGLGSDLCSSTSHVVDVVSAQNAQGRAASERQNFANLASADRQYIASQQSANGQFVETRDNSDKWGYRNNLATVDASSLSQVSFKDQLLEIERAKNSLQMQASANAAHAAECCCETKMLISEKACGIERQAADNKAALQLQASENACRIEMQVMKSGLEAARQLDNVAAAASRQADLHAAAANLQIQKYADAQTLLSNVLASKAAAEAAHCCCELKALISEKASQTDDLIRHNEMEALKRKLAQTERELLAVRLRPEVVAPV